jgi:hypothetical protein
LIRKGRHEGEECRTGMCGSRGRRYAATASATRTGPCLTRRPDELQLQRDRRFGDPRPSGGRPTHRLLGAVVLHREPDPGRPRTPAPRTHGRRPACGAATRRHRSPPYESRGPRPGPTDRPSLSNICLSFQTMVDGPAGHCGMPPLTTPTSRPRRLRRTGVDPGQGMLVHVSARGRRCQRQMPGPPLVVSVAITASMAPSAAVRVD